MSPRPLSAFETVARETPTAVATSASVARCCGELVNAGPQAANKFRYLDPSANLPMFHNDRKSLTGGAEMPNLIERYMLRNSFARSNSKISLP